MRRMNPEIDITKVVLRTKRLILRSWKESDLEDLYEYASVPGVGESAGWVHHDSMEESKRVLKMFMDGKYTFALECEGKVIGSLGIDPYNEKLFPEMEPFKCREIGYVLSKDYWGQGLMTEAVKEVLQYLFETENLDAVLCSHYLKNTRSARVQEKCGFRHLKNFTGKTLYGTKEPSEMNVLFKENRKIQVH